MPSKKIKRPAPTDCLICGFHNDKSPWHFSKHILSAHGLKIEEYVEKHMMGDRKVACLECGARTRFVVGEYYFKDYCSEHSYIAESKGGQLGGRVKKTWNKGKTKEIDKRIEKHVFYGELNPFFGKKHTEATKKINGDKHRLTEEEFIIRTSARSDFKCLSAYADYRYRQGQKLLFKCLTCESLGRDTVVEHTLFNFERNPLCKVCHPGGSKEQHEIADYIRSLGFEVSFNDRVAISPKEIDVYVPAKKFGVEYNSFYFHSYSEGDQREHRHLEKFVSCHWAGIDLMNVFQDEWMSKPDIVKSMIAHRLGVSKHRLHARNCKIVQLEPSIAREFFDANHIAGFTNAGVGTLALVDGDQIVAAMSFRLPFHKQRYKDKVEIARYATRLNTHVSGGLSKLLQHSKLIMQSKNFDGIITYADLRYGRGLGYVRAGFTELGWTGLSYDYHDNVKRMSRFKYRAQPELGLTEKEVAIAAGVEKIYGCGNKVYALSLRS